MNTKNENSIQENNTQENNDIENTQENNIQENNIENKRKAKKENRKKENIKNKKKKTSYLVLFIIIFFIIGVSVLAAWQWKLRNQNNYWLDRLAKNGIMEGRTLAEIQKLLNEVVEEGMFNVSINPDPVFENGKAEGNIAIENIPGNHYYTRVIITLNETGEVLFESGGIKPGQYIDYIKLKKALPKGDHEATAYFQITEPEKFAEIGRVNVDLTIHVLN